ncbi:MAG: pyrimidine dimer DNA glycosylase/endonuclease V, partial [Gammaproteobacteria bacterium]
FKQCRDPLGSLATYMWGIHAEARRRGYAFDAGKLQRIKGRHRLTVTRGQLQYELRHLKNKLWMRERGAYSRLASKVNPDPHPMFRAIAGGIEAWEKRAD